MEKTDSQTRYICHYSMVFLCAVVYQPGQIVSLISLRNAPFAYKMTPCFPLACVSKMASFTNFFFPNNMIIRSLSVNLSFVL